MSISVHVGLLSGQSCSVDVAPEDTVGELRRRVQLRLRLGISALVDASGHVLKELDPINKLLVCFLERGFAYWYKINTVQNITKVIFKYSFVSKRVFVQSSTPV